MENQEPIFPEKSRVFGLFHIFNTPYNNNHYQYKPTFISAASRKRGNSRALCLSPTARSSAKERITEK